MERRVVIIGGGLAGMIIAKEVRKRGLPVVILEADVRTGGKAGAEPGGREHGYHVFPGWYVNVRALLRELEIDDHLINITKFHVLRPGDFPRFVTFHQFSPLSNALRNVFSGVLPWPQMLLTFYFVIELAAESFNRRWFLDRESVNGFLRSRFDATESMATFQQYTALQASSIPNYELSAMTSQKVIQAWMATRTPLFSIFDGDLQTTFIAPFEKLIVDLGVDVQRNRHVNKLNILDGKVTGLTFDDGSAFDGAGSNDLFVLTTPLEATLGFVDQALYAAEEASPYQDRPRLGDLVHLTSAPMAALLLRLKRRIPSIPKEHVNLQGSRYGLSFVDVSQHWKGLPNTTLSLIAADFKPLSTVPEDQAADYLIDELLAYVPAIRREDIDERWIDSNVDEPLFLNTIGAWPNRPGTRTRIENLYTAGDYCQSDADLITMESAVGSALATARDILADAGLGAHPGPLPLKLLPRWQVLLLKYLGLPIIFPFGAYNWLRRHLDEMTGEG